MKRSVVAVVALVGVLLTAGCTGSPDATGDASDEKPAGLLDDFDFTATVEPDWVVDEQVIGSPAVEDGMVASYLLDDKKDLAIAVWDEETGRELWRNTAATSADSGGPGGAAVFSHANRSYVTYLVPTPDARWSTFVVADLATGKRVPITKPEVVADSQPSACLDGAAVCFTGSSYYSLSESIIPEHLRFELGTKKVTMIGDADIAKDHDYAVLMNKSRRLGEYVISTTDPEKQGKGREQLGYVEDRKVVWQRPYTEVFGPDYSSDAGWGWADDEDTEYAIGLGWPYKAAWADGTVKTKQVRHVKDVKIVALDRATGDTVWSLDQGGVCPYRGLDIVDRVLVACRWTAGELTREVGAKSFEYTEAPAADMLGIDPVTGDELWSIPLGKVDTESADIGELATGDDPSMILTETETLAVDLATGKSAPVGEGTFLCKRQRERFSAPDPAKALSGGGTTTYDSGDEWYPCDKTGTETKTANVSVGALKMNDTDDDSSVVVSGVNHMAHYTVPQSE
ncbi:hypothetical protein C8K30_103460 [Promicromonospora sp. AC04]|uniref:hypothetical protein n=1 Tax=Promicromonospora sp. AC04 TaxID=2135723 RepID=UPI000D49686D|nr:hypothetical protein [Promicromonospora sp. AC04]PUB29034.1 hypothetical protein C8K30_103460 [Promicromonospora sp. AC04]